MEAAPVIKAMIRIGRATAGAGKREGFIDACEQHGPEIAGTGTWLGGGRIAAFGRRGERRVMDGCRHQEPRAGGDCGTEGSMRGEHPMVPMAMPAWGRHQGRQSI
jgi:hypothetical protein